MTKKPLTKYEKKIKTELYWYAWQKHKANLTMTALANIFNTSLANFYQIIKRQNEKNN